LKVVIKNKEQKTGDLNLCGGRGLCSQVDQGRTLNKTKGGIKLIGIFLRQFQVHNKWKKIGFKSALPILDSSPRRIVEIRGTQQERFFPKSLLFINILNILLDKAIMINSEVLKVERDQTMVC